MTMASVVTSGTYHKNHNCGYCGSEDTAQSYGFTSLALRPETYEAMLNRGWRRSGRYMYKPDLRNTCCKLYAIRLEAEKFKSRREHRKDIHRFNRYIKGDDWDNQLKVHTQRLEAQLRKEAKEPYTIAKSKSNNNEFDLISTVHEAEYTTLINTPHPEDLQPAHNLTIELDTDQYTSEKFKLYLKYQTTIHKESKHETTPRSFERFLCSSPLHKSIYYDKETGQQRKTGSFHQLYRIDKELVAIAVLDFLPNTISSVYFIYDPDVVGKFGMGKISALREVAMCIEGGYKYYGLGLFAFGCKKLRYKGEMQPSELLDPVSPHPWISSKETYNWNALERFKPFVDNGQYYVTFKEDEISQNGNTDSITVNGYVPSWPERDNILFGTAPHPGERPYDPHMDPRIIPSLFRANMPGVHSREVIVDSEGFWGRWIFLQEDGEVKRYWRSDACVKEKIIREEVREMVAILDTL